MSEIRCAIAQYQAAQRPASKTALEMFLRFAEGEDFSSLAEALAPERIPGYLALLATAPQSYRQRFHAFRRFLRWLQSTGTSVPSEWFGAHDQPDTVRAHHQALLQSRLDRINYPWVQPFLLQRPRSAVSAVARLLSRCGDPTPQKVWDLYREAGLMRDPIQREFLWYIGNLLEVPDTQKKWLLPKKPATKPAARGPEYIRVYATSRSLSSTPARQCLQFALWLNTHASDRVDRTGWVPVNQIQTSDLAAYRIWVQKQIRIGRWTEHTAGHYLSAVRAMFRYLKNTTPIRRDPTCRWRHYTSQHEAPGKKAWTMGQIERALQFIRGLEDPVWFALFSLGLATGCRFGEAASLLPTDLDFHTATVHFLAKGPKERLVPLAQPAIEILEDYSRRRPIPRTGVEAFFLRYDGRAVNSYSVGLVFKALRHSHPNVPCHYHALRHTFVTQLIQQGVDYGIIARLVGHQDPGTTQRYVTVEEEETRQAILKLEGSSWPI